MKPTAIPARVEERPLPFLRRADLVAQRVAARGGASWIVKDPVALRYFQLGPEEGWLLAQLDGTHSLAALCRAFNMEFAPRRIEVPQLEGILRRLRLDNLLLTPGVEQGEALWEEGHRRLRKERIFAWLQPWALRFRGVDPSRFLNALYPVVRGVFSPMAALCAATLVFIAATLAVVRFDALTGRLPPLENYLRWENALWLALALCVVKVLHELAHGLTSRHFGVRCHELGVMLLAGVPCLYCNVTDAWLLPNRWQRVAIGAAGIATELVLAAAALLLWWASAPGFVNTLSFHVMLVCSVGTVLFNGNPLLRYDGYYILSDALALPNLRDESIARVEERLLYCFTGIPPREFASAGMPRWLPWYAAASFAYSVMVLIGLAWLCFKLLAPWGAGEFVLTAAAVCAVGMAVPSAMRMGRAARQEELAGEPVLRRFAWRGGIALALLATLAFIPLPCRVRAPGVIQPREMRQLYVLAPGQLTEALPPGAEVGEGETVAKLTNFSLAREVARLEGEARVRAARVEHLERLSVQDQDATLRLPAAREALADTEDRLRVARLEFARLEIKAPRAGILLPPEGVLPSTGQHELPSWAGTPLDPANRGAMLLAETLVGSVGDPSRPVALLACDEDAVGLLSTGQAVVLVCDQDRTRSLAGRVEDVSRIDMENAPAALSQRGLLPVRREGANQGFAPVTTLYQVRIALDEETLPITPVGGTVHAAVRVAPQSLFTRARRFLSRTFASTRS